jgi:hypothetical protein
LQLEKSPSTIAVCLARAKTAKMSLTNCRFYEEKYPEIESFVMVNVKQVRHIRRGKVQGMFL